MYQSKQIPSFMRDRLIFFIITKKNLWVLLLLPLLMQKIKERFWRQWKIKSGLIWTLSTTKKFVRHHIEIDSMTLQFCSMVRSNRTDRRTFINLPKEHSTQVSPLFCKQGTKIWFETNLFYYNSVERTYTLGLCATKEQTSHTKQQQCQF